MISSPGIAPVCDGDQLKLTCSITGNQVEWSVFGIPEGEMTARRYGRGLLNNGINQAPVDLMVNSVLFTFSRVSPPNTLPLITKLVTSTANNLTSIDETEVICQDTMTHNSSATIVNVIRETGAFSCMYTLALILKFGDG